MNLSFFKLYLELNLAKCGIYDLNCCALLSVTLWMLF